MINKIRKIIQRNLYRTIETREIEKEEMERLIKQGAILIDVRSPQEYKEGHIDGAILIPDYEIYKKAKEILKDKNQTIILYCQNGARSKKAYKHLKKIGYENIYNLYNGLENY